ncbi:Retrovirus-related Pol polyprotein from type-1 retrotransposable element R1 4 [Eumeta japonica]|uniref:Retrovirus-related Pol polyprotein from type-1 retrotransposable element R1 4 n=1 Tax=Eumeta variegata TaxID=151549 RepID=A0A4C1T0R8_EUMVA|nr:Retrovirus-related Pol polyprotein from type-1 retrotransposable element R1 4 [Eumeta japonica]
MELRFSVGGGDHLLSNASHARSPLINPIKQKIFKISTFTECTQILTGHGHFRKRLYVMKLSESKECDCGWSEETRDHVLWDCPLHNEFREDLMDELEREVKGLVYFNDLTSTNKNYAALLP